ncbi:MAG: hypothetical protein GF393_12940 [Armatimonadia bacterium]|nr:hypothetical protein [Armatimonadia bacterium]
MSNYGFPFDVCRMVTGTYTGDGADDRSIDIGVDLTTKSHVFVLVKSEAGTQAKGRTDDAVGDLSWIVAGADAADGIQSLEETGFQVGTSNTVNNNLDLYYYIVFYQE